MSTYTQLYYHLIFAPKCRAPVLHKINCTRLYHYLWQVLENKKCHPYAIGGIEDHIHIFTHIHQGLAIANLVKDLKLSSSEFIKHERLFPAFAGWQSGYAIFAKSHESKHEVIRYVNNQEEHHKTESSIDELRRLLEKEGVDFDERYLE